MSNKFVKMTKAGEEPINVHPSVVEDHKSLGWKVAEEKSADEAEQSKASAAQKAAAKKADAEAKAKEKAAAKKADAEAKAKEKAEGNK